MAASNLTKIDEYDDLIDLIASGKKIILKFTSTSCYPCKLYNPLLNKLKSDHPDINFVEVDRVQSEQIDLSFEVGAIPDIRFYFNGKQAHNWTVIGYDPSTFIKHFSEFVKL